VAGGVTSFSRVAPSFDGVSVMRRFFYSHSAAWLGELSGFSSVCWRDPWRFIGALASASATIPF
jgi:hypothetical protein